MALMTRIIVAAFLVVAFSVPAVFGGMSAPGQAPRASEFLPGLSDGDLACVETVPDQELGEMRGRYAGYYFSTEMSGYWDALGNQHAQINPNIVIQPDGVAPTGPGTELPADGMDVRVKAFVGSIQNTSGLIQITQVPGNNNIITQVMNLKLVVINVAGAGDIARILPQIAGF